MEAMLFVLIEGFIILMTYSALLILPALMTILCGTVYYKVSDLFKGICDYLENLNGISYKYSEIFKLLETYNLLLHVCAGNREGFFYDFFSALVLLVLGSLIIIAVVLCASRISFQIRRFRSILQIIHNYMLRNEDSTFKTLQLIRTMMNMEFPRMTAGGILDLEPVLILSVFGSVLTYGLLIIHNSLLPNEEKTIKTLQLIRTMIKLEFSLMTSGGVLDLKPVLILSMFGTYNYEIYPYKADIFESHSEGTSIRQNLFGKTFLL
ncbi:uncharacterized protein CEXT_176921 [Caerostris extrusa]|uniref:Gustatory receptor n=1 Tax=Caerostris extrusa TaxID=172846 RepID=A0AAV4T5H1_CAEEX|nr:uncharacterized protein CEXT_176921 [Caerostris extrusa]